MHASHIEKKRSWSSRRPDGASSDSEADLEPAHKVNAPEPAARSSDPNLLEKDEARLKSFSSRLWQAEGGQSSTIATGATQSSLKPEIDEIEANELVMEWLSLVDTLEWDRFSQAKASELQDLQARIFSTEGNKLLGVDSQDSSEPEEVERRKRLIWFQQTINMLKEWRKDRFKGPKPVQSIYSISHPGPRTWRTISDDVAIGSNLWEENRIFDISLDPDAEHVPPPVDLRFNRRERILYFFKNQHDYERVLGWWRPFGADPLLGIYERSPVTYRERWLQDRGPHKIEQTPLLSEAALQRLIEGKEVPHDLLKQKLVGVYKKQSIENYWRPLGAARVPITWIQGHTSMSMPQRSEIPQKGLNWDAGRYIPKEYESIMMGGAKPTKTLSPLPPAPCSNKGVHCASEPIAYDAGRYIPSPFQRQLQKPSTVRT